VRANTRTVKKIQCLNGLAHKGLKKKKGGRLVAVFFQEKGEEKKTT